MRRGNASDAFARRCERGLVALMGGALAVGYCAATRQRNRFETTRRRQAAVLDALLRPRPGGGTEFRFELPAADEAGDERPAGLRAAAAVS